MNKKMKRLIALVLSVVMVMALNITAFAAQNAVTATTYDVTFNFYQRDTTVIPNTQSVINAPITVTVDEDTTVMDALIAALAKANTSGHVYSSTWSGSGPYFLDAMTLNNTAYVNNYTIIGTTYTGTAWMWDDDLDGSSYPGDYMDEATITSNTDIYMIFEKSQFSW